MLMAAPHSRCQVSQCLMMLSLNEDNTFLNIQKKYKTKVALLFSLTWLVSFSGKATVC